MLASYKKALETRSPWLVAAVAFFAAFLAVGYHQVQIDAAQAMAMRHGLPGKVALEAFDSDANANERHEVVVDAVVDPDTLRTITSATGKRYLAIPLEGTERPGVLAYLISAERAPRWRAPDFSELGLERVAAVDRGVIVRVAGTLVAGQETLLGTLYDTSSEALGLGGEAHLIAARLIVRSEAFETRDLSAVRTLLLLLGLLSLGVSAHGWIWGRVRPLFETLKREPDGSAPAPSKDVKAFQPLATQHELAIEERKARRKSDPRHGARAPVPSDPKPGLRSRLLRLGA